jgi:hypothetical protein
VVVAVTAFRRRVAVVLALFRVVVVELLVPAAACLVWRLVRLVRLVRYLWRVPSLLAWLVFVAFLLVRGRRAACCRCHDAAPWRCPRRCLAPACVLAEDVRRPLDLVKNLKMIGD